MATGDPKQPLKIPEGRLFSYPPQPALTPEQYVRLELAKAMIAAPGEKVPLLVEALAAAVMGPDVQTKQIGKFLVTLPTELRFAKSGEEPHNTYGLTVGVIYKNQKDRPAWHSKDGTTIHTHSDTPLSPATEFKVGDKVFLAAYPQFGPCDVVQIVETVATISNTDSGGGHYPFSELRKAIPCPKCEGTGGPVVNFTGGENPCGKCMGAKFVPAESQ